MKLNCTMLCAFIALACAGESVDVKKTDTFRRIKSHLDRVSAIDTHDHLKPFPILQGQVLTERGVGMTLFSLWSSSYYTWINPLTPWPESGRFDDWWPKAKNDFANGRATSFYRYQLPAFKDLYGVDFETLTDEQARDLSRRIFANYQSEAWIYEVVTEFTRRCLAEALAEKVERGELREADALHIGQQVMRDNALELFPQLKDRLWKHKGKLKPATK